MHVIRWLKSNNFCTLQLLKAALVSQPPMAYMDNMDPDVCWPQKAVKLNHSLHPPLPLGGQVNVSSLYHQSYWYCWLTPTSFYSSAALVNQWPSLQLSRRVAHVGDCRYHHGRFHISLHARSQRIYACLAHFRAHPVHSWYIQGECCCRARTICPQTSDIRHTLVGIKIVDHSDVVEASPVSAAPTTSILDLTSGLVTTYGDRDLDQHYNT